MLNKFKTIEEIQVEVAECAAVSLKIIFEYHNIKLSKQKLRILLGTCLGDAFILI